MPDGVTSLLSLIVSDGERTTVSVMVMLSDVDDVGDGVLMSEGVVVRMREELTETFPE